MTNNVFPYYLIFINIVTFLVYGIDKWKAKQGSWRISEATLLMLAVDITYIMSKDIYKRRRASKEDADVWLAKGGTWRDERIAVWALGSTDSGVSWIVETEGRRIFHAGDVPH